MKVGDLVRLNEEAKRPSHITGRPDSDWSRVGILTEFTVHGEDGPLASGFVQWGGNADWDVEYAEDLEVISASR
jgi:hypothetical protein